MNKFLTLGVVALLAGVASIADGASAGQQGIPPGGSVQPFGSVLVVPGKRSDADRFVIRAGVKWFGNAYGRDPNGLIYGTLKGCDWESCYIVVDGRKILVAGLPGDIVDQQHYHGKTMVLVGRLLRFGADRRQHGELTGNRTHLAGVLIVDRFYYVTK
jgi:hypothetical protein